MAATLGNTPLTTNIYSQQEVDAAVAGIDAKIPAQASAANQLADKAFVNSSIATNTANYISYNGGPFPGLAELETYEGALTNNDYAFVVGTDAAGNTTYTRYKYNAFTEAWAAEYVLNNSSFTAAQWAAISSGITSGDVQKLDALPTAVELAGQLDAKAGKNDVYSIAEVDGMMSGKADTTALTTHTSDTAIHTTAAEKAAWDAKADAEEVAKLAKRGYVEDLHAIGGDEEAETLTHYEAHNTSNNYSAAAGFRMDLGEYVEKATGTDKLVTSVAFTGSMMVYGFNLENAKLAICAKGTQTPLVLSNAAAITGSGTSRRWVFTFGETVWLDAAEYDFYIMDAESGVPSVGVQLYWSSALQLSSFQTLSSAGTATTKTNYCFRGSTNLTYKVIGTLLAAKSDLPTNYVKTDGESTVVSTSSDAILSLVNTTYKFVTGVHFAREYFTWVRLLGATLNPTGTMNWRDVARKWREVSSQGEAYPYVMTLPLQSGSDTNTVVLADPGLSGADATHKNIGECIFNFSNTESYTRYLDFQPASGYDFVLATKAGEELADLTTFAPGAMARLHLVSTGMQHNSKDVWLIERTDLTINSGSATTWSLNADGTVSTEGELNADGTLTVEGELNADGTLTVEAQ